MASPLSGSAISVGAHNLLNSASVVVLATSLLRDNWERMPEQDRVDMLGRLARHGGFLAAGLKQLVQTGVDPIDPYRASARHRA
jgi:hypothetical protein